MPPLPILFLMLLFFGFWLVLYAFRRGEARKRRLPQREAYLAEHGGASVACPACGSSRLQESGLSHGTDRRRLIACGDCRQMLYQFEREAAPED